VDQAFDTPSGIPAHPSRTKTGFWRGLTIVAAAVALTLLAWFMSRHAVADLGSQDSMQQAGAYEHWAQGNVIMLIRHAERCDRSTAACLGPADGITQTGSQAARSVGQGLASLGLSNALTLVSPLTRTRQTAEFLFGKSLPHADWLHSCDSGFAETALANKRRHQNLVLVTHSGCIDHFLRTLDVQPGERGTEYAEAVLISVDKRNRPHLLGSIKADQWTKLTSVQTH
jgi:phosphohistidine phosphatase SixA